jgi:hypothetical protein
MVRSSDGFARRRLSWSLFRVNKVWLAYVREFVFATEIEG